MDKATEARLEQTDLENSGLRQQVWVVGAWACVAEWTRERGIKVRYDLNRIRKLAITGTHTARIWKQRCT